MSNTGRTVAMRAALYARFSTDKQSENSIADQIRVCERLAERCGFEVVERFSDAAVSGGTAYRAGYQRLLEAARHRVIDVIVAEDISRLWRLLAEQAPRLAELRDLGVHVVTHDLDTRQANAGILGAVNGAMSEQYRQEIARRTRRGLEGRARARQATGGRSYGYVAARDTADGKRAIHAEQAAIVRRIFRMYAEGAGPRTIAATLNEERVPSPGSRWNRITRGRAAWVQSAIAGDAQRGIGILNNELYIGRIVWNRFTWVRSASDSSRRRPVLNARSEWIVHTDERLRIVPQELWDRVKARQRARSEDLGKRVRHSLNAVSAKRAGRKPKYLFSGLLNCGTCGSRFVVADRTHYACASRLNGGAAACASDVRVKREIIESGLLAGIKNDLLAPDVMAEVRRHVHQIVRDHSRTSPDEGNRLHVVEREVANLTDAIASGTLRASAALAERLARAEAELARLRAAPPPPRPLNVERLLPQVVERYRGLVDLLESSLAETDVDMARAELRTLFGSIRVVSDEREVRLEADLRGTQATLLRAVGASANNVVAGARFGTYFQPRRARIRLT